MSSQHNWMGRPIIHPSHNDHLERDAALNEFAHGMPREEAEEAAYKSYSQEHHKAGAAFHLRGMRAAQANRDMDESKKHGIAYAMHMGKLDLDPMEGVPPEIEALASDPKHKSAYKFKSSPVDALLL